MSDQAKPGAAKTGSEHKLLRSLEQAGWRDPQIAPSPAGSGQIRASGADAPYRIIVDGGADGVPEAWQGFRSGGDGIPPAATDRAPAQRGQVPSPNDVAGKIEADDAHRLGSRR